MQNDGRELRRNSDFGVAAGNGRKRPGCYSRESKLSLRRTSRSRLREVDFEFEGQMLRGLEQNPNTGSRWARLAREGKKVRQVLIDRRYVANVVDGKVQFYGRGSPGG